MVFQSPILNQDKKLGLSQYMDNPVIKMALLSVARTYMRHRRLRLTKRVTGTGEP